MTAPVSSSVSSPFSVASFVPFADSSIPKNAFYAQSGGVTAVINATAAGVIEAARAHSYAIGTVYAGFNGILGALQEELVDTAEESAEAIHALRHTPGGAFGSCRYRLPCPSQDDSAYRRLIEVFAAHNIGYFFYNGGGDSQDTTHKVAQMSETLGYPLRCIGIPKTVDNDLPLTDCCPGFGSVAKYVAISTQEAALDIASMCKTSTKVFLLEVMGRHAGWIAAASGLGQQEDGDPPHLILFPEIPFVPALFLEQVDQIVKQKGYCVIVVSEGLRAETGELFSQSNGKDAFGHAQLGGVVPQLAALIKKELGYKYHWAVADYLQRAARHVASATDVKQAYALGQRAVELALMGKTALMPVIRRLSDAPYRWDIGEASLADIANVERLMPRDYIRADGFGITPQARTYLQPLIEGEDYPPYRNGLPVYARLKLARVAKKLHTHFVV